MEEQLISFETAKLAKEKGFSEDVIDWFELRDGKWVEEYPPYYDFEYSCYNTSGTDAISRPNQSLLKKWLREVHKISVNVFDVIDGNFVYEVSKLHTNEVTSTDEGTDYEDVLENGLVEALKLV